MRRKNKQNNYKDYQFNDYNYGLYNKQPEIKKKSKISGVALICILNFIVFGISLGGNILIETFGNYYGYTFQELELWRLLTNIFLHGSLIHIGCNTVSLLQLGTIVEAKYGKENFLFIYIISGIGASAISALFNMIFSLNSISVGASGAICGLLGFMFGKLKGNVKNKLLSLGFLIVPFLIVGISGGNVDNVAHFGGIFVGFLIGRLFHLLKIDDAS